MGYDLSKKIPQLYWCRLDQGDYYNRYLIADNRQVYGIINKSEAEAAIFKRGDFNHIIKTPFGQVAVGICYDARRKRFYEKIKNEKIVLFVFPHGSPAHPKKKVQEQKINNELARLYIQSFNVPVIYINSYGQLEYMPGIMGQLMHLARFKLNGKSKIYTPKGKKITTLLPEAQGCEIKLTEKIRKKELIFYGDNLLPGNFFFRHTILKLDIYLGIKKYQIALKKLKKLNKLNQKQGET